MSDACMLVERGWWVRGATMGRGVVVVSPNHVGFLFTERPAHLGVEFVWGAAGFVEHSPNKIDPRALIAWLNERNKPMAAFFVLRERLAGIVWGPREATVRAHRIPLRRRSRGLWFVSRDETIRLSRAVPVAEMAQHREALARWSWEPAPPR